MGSGYWRRRRDPLTSLALTAPVFVVYHLGILFLDTRNGVDLVSELTLRMLDRSPVAYAAFTVAVAAGFVVAAWWARGRGRVQPSGLVAIVAESGLLAIGMMVIVGWATEGIFAAQIARGVGPFEGLVMAAGAGFHEELVFRVVLLSGVELGLVALLRFDRGPAVAMAVVLSSLAFSAIHYIGPMADPWSLVSFTFRFLAGVYLALVYRWRGFAVAVYTHTLYDLLVMLL